jgi:tripartite-type tricarboxylate transporter receptor subunit TctC
MVDFCRLGLFAGAIALVSSVASSAQAANSVETFYRGKTITFYIGAATGAAYDLVGRAVATHIGRHIPGEPSVVVQNMPGAGSLIMINHLYNRAPRDGTALGLPLNGVLLEQRLQLYESAGGAVRFDLTKMAWVGSPAEEPQVMWAWHTSPYKTFEDIRRTEITLGATSPTADNYLTPLLAQRLLGGKIKLISGYKAVNDIFLAAERGEVQGNSTPLAAIMLGKQDDFRSGKIRVLAQFGTSRLRQLPDVPTGIELAPDEETRALLEFWALKFQAAYPIALPPETPEDRTEALRAAFDATMIDTDFKTFAGRVGLELTPVSGREIKEIVSHIQAAADEKVAKIRAALSP